MRRWLLLLYPRTWRRRYGVEFAALLEQQPLTPRSMLNIACGALDAHRTAGRQRHVSIARVRLRQGREQVMKRGPHPYNCSFCGKSQEAVRRLIGGPGGVCICDECITLCNEIITNEEHVSLTSPPQNRSKVTRRRAHSWLQRFFGRWHLSRMNSAVLELEAESVQTA